MSNETKILADQDPYSGLSNNNSLASLLARIAGLAGVAVPLHRFSYPVNNEQGIELEQLDVVQRATELWMIRFPSGAAKVVKVKDLNKSNLPALWLPGQGTGARLIRGVTHQGFLLEEEDWSTSTFARADLAEGVCLLLSVGEDSISQAEKSGYSAKDWFVYAIRKRRSVFFEAVFATFMLSVFGLMSALYTMQVYDRVVPTKGFSTLWVLTAGVLLAIFFDFVMKLVRAHMVDRASKVIDIELSAVFFGKALDIRAESRPRTVGTFASQIRHFESVRGFMTSSTLFILADAPFALFFILVIYILAGPVALVPLTMLPLGLLIGFLMKGPIERYTAEHMEESNKKNGLLIEAIDSVAFTSSADNLSAEPLAATAGGLFLSLSDAIPLAGHLYHWKSHALIDNVSMTLAEELNAEVTPLATATTDTSGQFSLTSTLPGERLLSASKEITDNDISRVVTSADALAALKIAVGLNPNGEESLEVSPYQMIAADVNKDGRVNSADALQILKVAVGLSDSIPQEWLFVNEGESFWDESVNSGVGAYNFTNKEIFWDSEGLSFVSPDTVNANFVGVLLGDVNGSWSPPEGAETLSHSYFSELEEAGVGPPQQWFSFPLA